MPDIFNLFHCPPGFFFSFFIAGACLRDSDLFRDTPAKSGKNTVLLLLTGPAAAVVATAVVSSSAPRKGMEQEAVAADQELVSLVERFAALCTASEAAVSELDVNSSRKNDWAPAWIESGDGSEQDENGSKPVASSPRLVFPPTLSARQRFVVHEAAIEKGLRHSSSGSDGKRSVAISASAQPVESSSELKDGSERSTGDAPVGAAVDTSAAMVPLDSPATTPKVDSNNSVRDKNSVSEVAAPERASKKTISGNTNNSGNTNKSTGGGGGVDLKALAMERAERQRQKAAASTVPPASAAPTSTAKKAADVANDEWLVEGPTATSTVQRPKSKKAGKKTSGSGSGGGGGSKKPANSATKTPLPVQDSGGGDNDEDDDEMAFLDNVISSQAAATKAAKKADPGRGWKR